MKKVGMNTVWREEDPVEEDDDYWPNPSMHLVPPSHSTMSEAQLVPQGAGKPTRSPPMGRGLVSHHLKDRRLFQQFGVAVKPASEWDAIRSDGSPVNSPPLQQHHSGLSALLLLAQLIIICL